MKKRGIGYACTYMGNLFKLGAYDESNVKITLDLDGKINIYSAAAELGQGLDMVLRIVVSESFGGLALNNIRIHLNDSLYPDGMSTVTSRQTTVTGKATYQASEILSAKIKNIASEIIDTPFDLLIWNNGDLINRNFPSKCVNLETVANEANRIGVDLAVQSKFVPPPTTPLNDENGRSALPINSFSYATLMAEVEVDTTTGEVEVLKLKAVMDSGKIINIAGAEGQVEGGLLMGLGFALTEDFKHYQGSPMTRGFTQYSIPTFIDCNDIEVHFIESAPGFGPYGAKGLGESPTVITAPAIVNAIYDAIGSRIYELPATSEQVFLALKKSQKKEDI